jgi:hypothetical protein
MSGNGGRRRRAGALIIALIITLMITLMIALMIALKLTLILINTGCTVPGVLPMF